jgi:hypothetical protein
MSATSKRNVYNIEKNVCNTQHYMSATSRLNICNIEKIMVATSKNLDLILKHSHETLATYQEHGCNMCTMICNINEKRLYHEDDRLQHVKNIVTTPIHNICNIKNKKQEEAGSSWPAWGSGGTRGGPRGQPRCWRRQRSSVPGRGGVAGSSATCA